VAGQIKGKADTSPQPRPFSLTRGPETNDEDDFKSCNGSIEREDSSKTKSDAINIAEVWDRYQYAPPKRVEFLKPHVESDPY
jgi:hypothetical protein